jgi:hypothetical protein
MNVELDTNVQACVVTHTFLHLPGGTQKKCAVKGKMELDNAAIILLILVLQKLILLILCQLVKKLPLSYRT